MKQKRKKEKKIKKRKRKESLNYVAENQYETVQRQTREHEGDDTKTMREEKAYQEYLLSPGTYAIQYDLYIYIKEAGRFGTLRIVLQAFR